MKKPNDQDAQRCLDLRCRGKRGEYLRPDDIKFLEKMYRQYPDWAAETQKDVFEATKPFGAV